MKRLNRSAEQDREYAEAGWVDIEQPDEVQAELDAIAEQETNTQKRKQLKEPQASVLKSYVHAHSKLSEKKKAYNLAMWVLRKGKK
jgi:hypothetical protein